MGTTVRLGERLLREAKEFAARNGRTLTVVIEDALRQYLSQGEAPRGRRPFLIRPFKGSGLAAGVDLANSAALLELMEKRQ